jgi:hypothetical protein
MNQLLREFTEARTKLIRQMQDEGTSAESVRALADLQNAIAAVQAELTEKFGEQSE